MVNSEAAQIEAQTRDVRQKLPVQIETPVQAEFPAQKDMSPADLMDKADTADFPGQDIQAGTTDFASCQARAANNCHPAVAAVQYQLKTRP